MGWKIYGLDFAVITTKTTIKTMGVGQFKTKRRNTIHKRTHTVAFFTPKTYSLHWILIFFLILILILVFYFSWWAALWCVLFGCCVDYFRNRRIYWNSSNCVAAVTDLCYVSSFICQFISFCLLSLLPLLLMYDFMLPFGILITFYWDFYVLENVHEFEQ